MAVSTLSALKTAISHPHVVLNMQKASGTSLQEKLTWYGEWKLAGSGGVGGTPSTAATCSSATTGAMAVWPTPSGATLRMIASNIMPSGMNKTLTGMNIIVFDRLSHQGGLSGTVTTAQTTNLPTAALPRFTSGVGVMPFLEVYSGVGGTATTVTASYTNQAGTSGQTTVPVSFGGSFASGVQMLPLPLADGDTGCRSVESVTLAGTTGTAGNFGVTLAIPLFVVNAKLNMGNVSDLIRGMGSAALLPDSACLMFAGPAQGGTSYTTGPIGVSASFVRT